nr:hypothetical protein OH826_35600 [Streptomyces sp. NBC_00899]
MFALTNSALMELRLAKNLLDEQLKKKKAEYANVTQFLQASDFDFVVCPRCMQRLENRPVPADHCVVCLQPDPRDADVDPDVVQQTRRALEEQLQDASAVQDADMQVLQRAQEAAEQAEFRATTLRRQLDALTRNTVAPRFEAIAQSSARVATLKATIDAVAQLRDFWTRARSINQTVRDIAAERKELTAAFKARTADLQSRQTLVAELSTSFRTILEDFQPPWEVESAVVDPDSYLPVVTTRSSRKSRRPAAASACVNLAYSLALFEFGLTHPDVLVPSFLIIDSPRRVFGNNPEG